MFRNLKVKRVILKKRIRANGNQQITILLQRSHRFPIAWYAAYEGERSRGYIVFPWFRKEVQITYAETNLPRGLYELREVTLLSGDLFGLVKQKKTFDLHDTFLVHPEYSVLKNWIFKDHVKGEDITSARTTSQNSTSVVGVREYQQGDRLSQIHWKASAKNGVLRTKEFENHVSHDLLVLLDTHRKAYNTGQSFEKAISLVASIMYSSQLQQNRYTFLTQMQIPIVSTRVLKGKRSEDFQQILDLLARITCDAEKTFPEFIAKTMEQHPQASRLVLVTSRIDQVMYILLGELVRQRKRIELFYFDEKKEGLEWIQKLKRMGVICHHENG
nr:DUF58 domain-containing protein [Ammoniphilus resinae]